MNSTKPDKTYETIDEFIDNVENEIKNQSIFEDISDFFVYTIWNNGIKENYWKIKWYFKNLILFQSVLWTWRPWDSQYQMDLFAFGLDQVANAMENGNEERTSANKKIAACNELSKQLRRDVENEVGWYKGMPIEEYSNKVAKATEERFNEIHRLMKGQNKEEYKKLNSSSIDEEYVNYVNWFDGSGIESWWN